MPPLNFYLHFCRRVNLVQELLNTKSIPLSNKPLFVGRPYPPFKVIFNVSGLVYPSSQIGNRAPTKILIYLDHGQTHSSNLSTLGFTGLNSGVTEEISS